MKSCPLCHKTYEETMMFCLYDGTALLQVTTAADDPNATLVLPTARVTEPGRSVADAQAPAVIDQPMTAQGDRRSVAPPGLVARQQTRKSPLPWILGLGMVIVIGFLGIVIAFVVMSIWQSQRANQEGSATSSPSPAGIAAIESPSSTSSDNSSDLPRSATAGTSPGRTPPQTTSTPKSTTTVISSADLEPPPPPKQTPPRAPISGGVLNGKAVHLVQPSYPAIARQAHASGTVIVQVTIDENGNVISAHAVSGHPLLQAAAAAAARASKFSPTKLSGQPVKVTGIIQYNFVAQ